MRALKHRRQRALPHRPVKSLMHTVKGGSEISERRRASSQSRRRKRVQDARETPNDAHQRLEVHNGRVHPLEEAARVHGRHKPLVEAGHHIRERVTQARQVRRPSPDQLQERRGHALHALPHVPHHGREVPEELFKVRDATGHLERRSNGLGKRADLAGSLREHLLGKRDESGREPADTVLSSGPKRRRHVRPQGRPLRPQIANIGARVGHSERNNGERARRRSKHGRQGKENRDDTDKPRADAQKVRRASKNASQDSAQKCGRTRQPGHGLVKVTDRVQELVREPPHRIQPRHSTKRGHRPAHAQAGDNGQLAGPSHRGHLRGERATLEVHSDAHVLADTLRRLTHITAQLAGVHRSVNVRLNGFHLTPGTLQRLPGHVNVRRHVSADALDLLPQPRRSPTLQHQADLDTRGPLDTLQSLLQVLPEPRRVRQHPNL